MGIFGRIKNFFMEKKLNKELDSLGNSYLNGLEALVSSVQIYRAVDRQLHKELFGSTASEKLEEIERERKGLQISIERTDYILKFLSKGKVKLEDIPSDYEPEVLARHKQISLQYTADMINLIVQVLVYSEYTNTIYDKFDEIFEGIDIDKESIFNEIEDTFKDNEKTKEHVNYVGLTLFEEFGLNPLDPNLKLPEMINNLLIASREYPDQIELLLNRPATIDVDEEGKIAVML